MDERENNVNNIRHNIREFPNGMLGSGGRKLLRRLRYVVPDELAYKKWWRLKFCGSILLPLAAAIFSWVFFSLENLYIIAIGISVLYKTLTTVCEYNNYKQSGTGQRASGIKPENPLLAKLITIGVALVFVFVIISAHISKSDEVTFLGVVLICGRIDIIITCLLDIVEALAQLYNAALPHYD